MITIQPLPRLGHSGVIIRRLLNESIRELCFVDHGNDPLTILAWLENAEHNLLRSDFRIGTYDGDLLLGVAGVAIGGDILTNYVAPAGVGFGAGTLMLREMENWVKLRGHARTHVYSTATARNFYFHHGYQEHGAIKRGAGRSWDFPMRKFL